MPSRFVRPSTRVLTLANGDRLIVRARLTAGEVRAKFNRLFTAADANGVLQANRMQVGLAQVTAYLLDWSLADDDGRPVVIRDLSIPQLEVVLDSLSPEAFREIQDAIDAHETAMRAERDAEKKTDAGPTLSEPTFSSPGAAAGAMSGSGS